MLRFTLDTSSTTALAVEDQLNELARQPVSPGDAEAVNALLAHGRLLHELLPATDRMLKSLCGAPEKANRLLVRDLIVAHQAASRATADRFRIVLYITSLTLVAALVYLGIQLQQRAWALRRRAAFEHVLAGISIRFLNSRTTDIDRNIDQALADMAECVGADRAYFAVLGPSPCIHKWNRGDIAFPPNWPDSAPVLAAKFSPAFDSIVQVVDANSLARGAKKDAFAALGMQGWAMASGVASNGASVILGFDAVQHPCRIMQVGELSLLRTALTAIVNAVDQQLAEVEKVQLEMRLQQARRMETLGAFASGIAHNFNNIVGAILGFAEMAQAQVVADSRPARNVVAIRRSAERARDLVDQILAFGRRSDTRRGRVEVSALIAEATTLLNASLPPGIDLVIRDVPAGAAVSGEAAQLQQVILNLCSNAAQALDGIGRIDVETRVKLIVRTQQLSHGSLGPGAYVCIAVKDAGSGMDAATLERIFEPFFTLRSDGNGLGLATVREIIREYGGAMHVESVPGKGSCFEAWLPCATGAEPIVEEEAPSLPLGSGEALLMVDTNGEQLLRSEEILAALGYEPIGFSAAEEALSCCSKAPERFDAFVIGQLGTAKAALELAAALHKIAPDLPIILATGSAEEIDVRALLGTGICEVVRRPLVAHEVANALTRRNEAGFPERRRAVNS